MARGGERFAGIGRQPAMAMGHEPSDSHGGYSHLGEAIFCDAVTCQAIGSATGFRAVSNSYRILCSRGAKKAKRGCTIKRHGDSPHRTTADASDWDSSLRGSHEWGISNGRSRRTAAPTFQLVDLSGWRSILLRMRVVIRASEFLELSERRRTCPFLLQYLSYAPFANGILAFRSGTATPFVTSVTFC